MKRLTRTQFEIATLQAAGLSVKEIACQKERSVKTIEAHVFQIYRKLEVHSRKDVAAALQKHGPPIPEDKR